MNDYNSIAMSSSWLTAVSCTAGQMNIARKFYKNARELAEIYSTPECGAAAANAAMWLHGTEGSWLSSLEEGTKAGRAFRGLGNLRRGRECELITCSSLIETGSTRGAFKLSNTLLQEAYGGSDLDFRRRALLICGMSSILQGYVHASLA
jgi:hypothetical protein